VAHWFDENGVAHLSPARVLVPPEEQGVALRKADVLRAADEMRELYGAEVIVLDPENDGEVVAQDLEDAGFEVVAHSQKPLVMAQAAERFYAAVREQRVRHPRDPKLTRHVLNAVEKRTDDGRWRFVKENKQSRKVIDALIAAAMVHNVAVEDSATAPEPMFAWA
jgi:phage terminase large subunit-like protein